jgi:hypothetical protein
MTIESAETWNITGPGKCNRRTAHEARGVEAAAPRA